MPPHHRNTQMNEYARLQRMLERDRVIAVVGLSNRAHRPSYVVSAYMKSHGYRIVPVNPAWSNDTAGVLGERCFATLTDAAASLAAEGVSIDMVNVFRRSEEVLPIADEAVRINTVNRAKLHARSIGMPPRQTYFNHLS